MDVRNKLDAARRRRGDASDGAAAAGAASVAAPPPAKEPEILTEEEQEQYIQNMLVENQSMRQNWLKSMVLLHLVAACGFAYFGIAQALTPFKDDAAFFADLRPHVESSEIVLALLMGSMASFVAGVALFCASKSGIVLSMIPGAVPLLIGAYFAMGTTVPLRTFLIWYSWIPAAPAFLAGADIAIWRMFDDAAAAIADLRKLKYDVKTA